jgi:hypothetical protein
MHPKEYNAWIVLLLGIFIDPKSSEILSIFQVFPCTTQIALFWPKLLPALFLKKPWYLCPFEILEEALVKKGFSTVMIQGWHSVH